MTTRCAVMLWLSIFATAPFGAYAQQFEFGVQAGRVQRDGLFLDGTALYQLNFGWRVFRHLSLETGYWLNNTPDLHRADLRMDFDLEGVRIGAYSEFDLTRRLYAGVRAGALRWRWEGSMPPSGFVLREYGTSPYAGIALGYRTDAHQSVSLHLDRYDFDLFTVRRSMRVPSLEYRFGF